MGKVDSAAKEYFSDNVRFADLCNAVLFHGEQVVDLGTLEEKDSTEVLSVFGADAKQIHIQKWRDLLKNTVVKANGKACFVLIGIEAQANIHYAMPVKNMIYDAINYGYQVNEIAKMHRHKKDTESEDEFLSGFTLRDRIIPVITITVYLGDKSWDAPRFLSDMYGDVDERLKPYLSDFNANVFVPSEFDDFDRFQTQLKQVFELISAAGDKDAMNEILHKDEKFQALDNETVRAINDFVGTDIPLNAKGVVNMCQAWKDQYDFGRTEGRMKEIFSSVEEGDYSIERGAQKAGMSVVQFKKEMEKSGYRLPVEA